MQPRIAIPIPTSGDTAYNQRSWPSYANAVRLSGGEPIAIELDSGPMELKRIAASCDGVLLPGSPADVNPVLYGAERDPASAYADPDREAVDILLLDHAARHAEPVLGICFGVQSINVWRGGSLIQDLTPLPVNHSAGGQVAIAHTALIPPGSVLAGLLSSAEAPLADGFLRLPVNSSHHQAIAAPGEGLRVVARCPNDGVIEAVEMNEDSFHVEHSDRAQFLLGVQWHPERSYEISAASRAIFDRLIEEARSYASLRSSNRTATPESSEDTANR